MPTTYRVHDQIALGDLRHHFNGFGQGFIVDP
jgi:hypothetical protein